jgi:hypothetical protein
MPFTAALVVSGIVLVFALFAVVLAWGEYQTRHLDRNQPSSEAPKDKEEEDLKRAA